MRNQILVWMFPLLVFILGGCSPAVGELATQPAAVVTLATQPSEESLGLLPTSGDAEFCAADTPCDPAGTATPAGIAFATAHAATPTGTHQPAQTAAEASKTAPAQASLTTTPRPSPACPPGKVDQQSLASQELNRDIAVRVYLPPCYDPVRAAGYPVVYLLHGQSMDATAWESFGVVNAANRLMANGDIQPLLLVMPEENYYLQELHQSNFGKAVVNELIPWMDDHYNTCFERSCRAIGGVSRGATWAIMLGLENSELFGAVGAHSLPFPPMSSSRLHTLIDAAGYGPPAMRIDIGQADPYYSAAARFEEALQLLNVPHEWIVEEGTHNAAYWTAQVEKYLRWYGSVLIGD